MARILSNGTIEVVLGDDLSKTFTSVTIDGVSVDWTGYTSNFIIKLGNTTKLTLTESSGIDLSTNGQIGLLITDAQITALGVGQYTYDWNFTYNDITTTWFNNKKFKVIS
jgi:hypothetical protein